VREESERTRELQQSFCSKCAC